MRVKRPRPKLDFLKLSWLARRGGERGRVGLIVLQDALLHTFGPQFERTIEQAKRDRQRGSMGMVVFSPYKARWVQRQPAIIHPNLPTYNYPFDTVTPGQLADLRRSNIVVWTVPCGFSTYRWINWRRR